jgi:hypothetical protein
MRASRRSFLVSLKVKTRHQKWLQKHSRLRSKRAPWKSLLAERGKNMYAQSCIYYFGKSETRLTWYGKGRSFCPAEERLRSSAAQEEDAAAQRQQQRQKRRLDQEDEGREPEGDAAEEEGEEEGEDVPNEADTAFIDDTGVEHAEGGRCIL